MFAPGTKLAWAFLLVAVLFEILFAIGIKKSNGFTDPLGSVLALVAVPGGLFFLSLGLRNIPLGIAYPVWTALASVGVLVVSRLIFDEVISIPQFIAVGVIIGGVVFLKFFS